MIARRVQFWYDERMQKRYTANVIIGLVCALLLSACLPAWASIDQLPWIETGEVLFEDDFSDRTTGWENVNDVYELKGYSENAYIVSLKNANSRSWSVPGLRFKDTAISVHTQRISGAQDTNFGLICRYQDAGNYYSFVISSDGYYAVFRVINGEETLLGMEQFVYSESIARLDGINEILVICAGDQLSLAVNGKTLHTVHDDTFSAGDAGLIVETREAGGATVLFTDFSVTKQ